ncbi:CLUMA_CG014552, isoform A [Clunio marinus]|uniref:CLUMA_CG014552, isoform A n=1 Tax=Clunio marinus TaxID=568069 RepID=A0A1J1INU4_9DIPT|nr:CLUMA_CG014552, isoform A [Clunio marinus]
MKYCSKLINFQCIKGQRHLHTTPQGSSKEIKSRCVVVLGKYFMRSLNQTIQYNFHLRNGFPSSEIIQGIQEHTNWEFHSETLNDGNVFPVHVKGMREKKINIYLCFSVWCRIVAKTSIAYENLKLVVFLGSQAKK